MSKFYLSIAAIAASFIATSCGGSTENQPSMTQPYKVTLLAGSSDLINHVENDSYDGCIDTPSNGATFHPWAGALAKTPSGEFLFLEDGSCDGRQRIRSINPAENTIKTLSIGWKSSANKDDFITTFWSPTSLATGSDGSIYIGDSSIFSGQPLIEYRNTPGRGPGIWKLDPSGDIKPLAGISLPEVMFGYPSADGVGSSASFGSISKICMGSNGLLYVNDNANLRTVDKDGLVTTVKTENVFQHHLISCGSSGGVLVHRRFNNPDQDDLFDPTINKSIGKLSDGSIHPLTYIGSGNLIATLDGAKSTPIAKINLSDGSSTLIAQSYGTKISQNLSSNPPNIATPLGATSINETDFVTITNNALLLFKQISN